MTTNLRMTDGQRRGLLAKAHHGKKQLGLDDDTWREMLLNLYGKRSCADLAGMELVRLVDHLASRGAVFTSRTEPRNKPGYQVKASGRRSDFYEIPSGPRARVKRYIAAMWRDLGYDMVSLDTRVQREFSVDSFRWLEDEAALSRLVADLEKRLKARERTEARQDAE